MKKNGLIVGLSLLAIVQLAAFGYRSANAGPIGRRVAVGDDVSELRVSDVAGAERPLASGVPALVLVFHSECGHCARIAPEWRTWLDATRPDAAVLAVSNEPIAAAAAYATRHGWKVDVASLEVGTLGGQAHAFTSRTPWVFVISANGVVSAEGHGAELTELARVLEPEASR